MPRTESPAHPRFRLFSAIALAISSIGVGAVLFATDGLRHGVSWTHHASISALPLFLVAAAIAAETVSRPRSGRHGLMRLVAIIAFVAWGTGQLLHDPTAAAIFNDAAVLLFVVDAGAAVITDARMTG